MKLQKKSYMFLLVAGIMAALVALPACSSGPSRPTVSASPQKSLAPVPDIQVASLAINPPEIDAGVDALVTARVTNTGSSAQNYVGEVKVLGGSPLPEFWYTPQVTIPAGDTKVLSVVINQSRAGTYRINWSGLTGDLVVKPAVLTEPGKSTSSVTVNVTAPDFSASELTSGQKISLSQYKGKVVLLNFVNYGCDPRLNGIVDKQFQAIKQLTGQRQDFVPVSVFCGCCPPEVLRQFTKQNGFNWPWILDSDNSVVRKYGSYVSKFGYPTLIIIDANQTIREVAGFKDQAALNSSLDKALSK